MSHGAAFDDVICQSAACDDAMSHNAALDDVICQSAVCDDAMSHNAELDDVISSIKMLLVTTTWVIMLFLMMPFVKMCL